MSNYKMAKIFRELVVSADDVAAEEEEIRREVRDLPDELRQRYFKLIEKKLRDPDTYAVLNWLFVGLHHMYLGRWLRGFLNIFLIIVAIMTIPIGVGLFILFAVLLAELIQLFRSQTIVADYNNEVARFALQVLGK